MPISTEKTTLKNLRDSPEAISEHLNKPLYKQDISSILTTLNEILLAQNVAAIARESGLRRDKLYGSFGGKVDPTLSRVLKLLWALNVRLVAVPGGPVKPPPQRPSLGRPKGKRRASNESRP